MGHRGDQDRGQQEPGKAVKIEVVAGASGSGLELVIAFTQMDDRDQHVEAVDRPVDPARFGQFAAFVAAEDKGADDDQQDYPKGSELRIDSKARGDAIDEQEDEAVRA